VVKSFSVLGLALVVTFLFSFQAGSQQYQSDTFAVKSIVHGAVEDTGWMRAADKKEVQVFLSSYFTGELLNDLVEQTWKFVKSDTDWYGTAIVEKMLVNSIDGDTVTVLAYIKEIDVTNKRSTGATGEFILKKTYCGWRISQMIIRE